MRKRKEDILLALVAAHEQLLWTRDLLRWKGTTVNEEIERGTKETLKVLEGILGTAALDMRWRKQRKTVLVIYVMSYVDG